MRNGYLYLIVLILGLVGCQTSYADFTSSLPRCEEPPYNSDQYYGNGLNCDFIKAYQGGTDPVSKQEVESLSALLPAPDFDFWTLRVGWNVVKQELRNIRNKTLDGAFIPGEVANDKSEGDGMVIDFGLGYTWKTWQIELEHLRTKKMVYNQNPVLINVGGLANSMSSEVKSTILILNLYRNFGSWYYFKPYVMAGLGLARHKVNLELSGALTAGGSAGSSKGLWDPNNYAFPVQVAVGLRFRLFSQVLADVKYRYAHLGRVRWEPVKGQYILRGSYQLTGLGFGIVFWMEDLIK